MTDDTLPTFNPETLFSASPTNRVRELCMSCHDAFCDGDSVVCDECAKLAKPLVDLTKRRDIVVDELHGVSAEQRYEAIDRITFDGDPESRWTIYGRGPTKQAAIHDLLDNLAEVEAAPVKHYNRIDCGPFEPAELRELPAETDDEGLPL